MSVWVLGRSAADSSAEEREALQAELAPVGGVLLKTCHRVELYGVGEPPATTLQVRCGVDAVNHLFRVAAGLESAIVGEDEVLHQVREALREAAVAGPVDGRLQRLFQSAVAAGRRARAGRTAAGAGLAGRAVEWLRGRAEIRERTVLVVGAGRMGSALAHEARKQGARVTVASRDSARARRLAHVYGGEGVDLAEGVERARESAGVAIALGGPWSEVVALGDPLPPIADISAPSAIPGELRARLNGGFLGVDDLFTTGARPPSGYARAAEALVAAGTGEYERWLEARS